MRWILVILLAAGCTPRPERADPLELRPAVDLDSDPGVMEVELVAEPGSTVYLAGKPTEVWGYRDAGRPGSTVTVPGPLIEVDVGTELVVRVRNELPTHTTVHWHGIRLPQPMDGTSLSQTMVMPGETFEYRFRAVDPGTFWYHPHMNADEQIERGLYGMLVVRGGVEPEVTRERTFMLDDVKLEASGALSEQGDDSLDLMVGRQGNVVLVNGVNASQARIDVEDGARERWRFVNAANGRFFNLSLGGQELRVIGWDGGLLAEPYTTTSLLISPGERYEVLVDLSATGPAVLQTVYYDRGHDLPDPGPIDLLQIEFRGSATPPAGQPEGWGTVQPLEVDGSTPIRAFELSEVEDGGDGSPRFYINGEAWPFSTPAYALFGSTEIWDVQNTAEMDHPFHLHGMFFQILDRDGVPETRLGWKDTVLIPQLSSVRFAVRYTGTGAWMFHCHILEHAELGMMGSLVVSTAAVPTSAP